MKVKTAYRLDKYIIDSIDEISKKRNMSINEILTLAVNCYDSQNKIKAKENKIQVSICVDDTIINKINDIAKMQDAKIVDVVTDVLNQFLAKKIL